LGLFYIMLSIRVIMVRGSTGASLGDGSTGIVAAGQEHTVPLLVRARSHANFAEYVPIALILIGLAEIEGTRRVALIIFAAMLMVGRLAHPIGMGRKIPNPYRAAGAVLTFSAIAAASIAILVNFVTS
jgi:uncharacterized membrane protein YecN with MAPEG domain